MSFITSKLTTKRILAWSATFVVLSFSIFTVSETAHAGLLSFMTAMLGSDQASANINLTQPVRNSQTIGLLQAHANINPISDVPTDIVPVDDGETLVADIAAIGTISTETGSAQISAYTVRQGDTISSVAKMFDVSINTVLWANDLTSKSILQPGQTLVILPISGITYTIKKGDTVNSIAQKYGADQNDILSYNDLSLSALKAGSTIIIPNAEITTPLPIQTLSTQRRITKAPYEPLLDNISNWPSYTGYYIRPISGGANTQRLHGHNAIDIGAPAGTVIRAAAAGTVIISRINGGWNGGYGNYVVISHPNGTQTLYAHMSRGAVTVGRTVAQGQTIGYVGKTGMSTGNHLHYEVRGAKNPEAY